MMLTWIAGAAELAAQRVAQRLERELRRRVRPVQRQRDAAGDRRDVHDPPARAAQRGQARLRDRELGDDVDLELAAQLVQRHVFERSADRDARVVDEPVEALEVERGEVLGVRDVELDGPHGRAERLPRGRVAHAGEHGRAELRERERGGAPDAGRGPGDQHGAAVERGHARETYPAVHSLECPACCSPSSPPPPRTSVRSPGGSRRSSGSPRRSSRSHPRSGSPAPATSPGRRASACSAWAGRR